MKTFNYEFNSFFSVQQHDGLPYCHKPCYGTLFGPKGKFYYNGNVCGCLDLERDRFVVIKSLFVCMCLCVREWPFQCIFHNVSKAESGGSWRSNVRQWCVFGSFIKMDLCASCALTGNKGLNQGSFTDIWLSVTFRTTLQPKTVHSTLETLARVFVCVWENEREWERKNRKRLRKDLEINVCLFHEVRKVFIFSIEEFREFKFKKMLVISQLCVWKHWRNLQNLIYSNTLRNHATFTKNQTIPSCFDECK